MCVVHQHLCVENQHLCVVHHYYCGAPAFLCGKPVCVCGKPLGVCCTPFLRVVHQPLYVVHQLMCVVKLSLLCGSQFLWNVCRSTRWFLPAWRNFQWTSWSGIQFLTARCDVCVSVCLCVCVPVCLCEQHIWQPISFKWLLGSGHWRSGQGQHFNWDSQL